MTKMVRAVAFSLVCVVLFVCSASAQSYTVPPWGVDKTTPTASPVCIMYGSTCKIRIGTANWNTGGWAIDPTSIGATTPGSGAFTTLSASGQITSTVATGTPPFVVASTSKVVNLYADRAATADVADAPSAAFPAFTGDSGAGGVKGLVPAPAAGDAAAGYVLGASGAWVAPSAVSSACPIGVMCITTYGAAPGASSSSAVQAAIDAAMAQPRGGAVYVPPIASGSCYVIDAQINIPKVSGKTLRLYGDGDGSCFANSAAMDAGFMFSVGDAVAAGGSGFVAENIAFRGRTTTTGKAFYLNNANATEFHGVHFEAMMFAVNMHASYGVIFDHNQFLSISDRAIFSDTSAHHTVIAKNKFFDCQYRCISIDSASDNIVIRDNDAEGGVVFFLLFGGAALTFEGNYTEYFSSYVSYFNATVYGGSISNNWLSYSGNQILDNTVGFRFDNNRSYNQIVTAGNAIGLRAHGNTVGGTGSTIADTNP